jgi:DtxR family Mn-dependent transcriptional regulator
VPKLRLSGVEVAYLKEAYKLTESGEAPSVSLLAKKFGVSMPSVIEVFDKLEEKGLLLRKPWKVPKLTGMGLITARRIIHNHRVIEVYFAEKLGLGTNYSCNEATKIDYLMENQLVMKMCDALNYPAKCIHGHSIEHSDCGDE